MQSIHEFLAFTSVLDQKATIYELVTQPAIHHYIELYNFSVQVKNHNKNLILKIF